MLPPGVSVRKTSFAACSMLRSKVRSSRIRILLEKSMLMLGWAFEVWPPRAVELFILMPQILHVAAGLLMASFGGVRFLCAILAGLGFLATVVFGSKKISPRESESSFSV